MSYPVELTPEAETDLRLIYRYIAEKKENPGAAFSLVNSIYDEIASLGEMPSRYPIWRNEPWKSRGIRAMPVDNYHVFYLVEENPQTVIALRGHTRYYTIFALFAPPALHPKPITHHSSLPKTPPLYHKELISLTPRPHLFTPRPHLIKRNRRDPEETRRF